MTFDEAVALLGPVWPMDPQLSATRVCASAFPGSREDAAGFIRFANREHAAAMTPAGAESGIALTKAYSSTPRPPGAWRPVPITTRRHGRSSRP